MQYIKKFVFDCFPVFIILILAGIVYFYKIDTVPNGFYIDEALPAYNAYSILKTGKDEYGKFLPIVFRFYGSYNPPLYTYLTVIPVSLFDLNVFSARFISVLAGLAFSLVIYIFLLHSELPRKKETAIIGAILSAFSPWIIFYSRIGYEVTLGLVLFALGAYFLWKCLKYPSKIIWSVIFFSLSTYAAYAERFVAPMVLVGFLILFRKKLFVKKNRKSLIWALTAGVITQLPNFYILFTPSFFPKTNLIATSSVAAQALRLETVVPAFIAYPLAMLREFFSQYFEYFSPKSLFFQPDPDLQRSIPAISVFYSWMVIPYITGIYSLLKNIKKDFYKYLALLLVIGPIPAAFTLDPFSTHRALPLAFPMIVLITLGTIEIKNLINSKIFMLLGILVIAVSAIFFWRSYFVFLPKERALVWQYGFEQLADEVAKRPGMHFVIDQTRLKPAYINMAFYLKYPPADFQKTVDQNIKSNYYANLPFNDHYNFGQVETRNVDWTQDIYKKQILVGDEYTISEGQAKEHSLTKVFEIRDPLERIIFEGFETNPDKASR